MKDFSRQGAKIAKKNLKMVCCRITILEAIVVFFTFKHLCVLGVFARNNLFVLCG